MKIQVICAWCDKWLGEKDSEGEVEITTSHGICPECKEKLIKEVQDRKSDG